MEATIEQRVQWGPDDAQRALSAEDLIEQTRADLADSLRAYLTFPAAQHVLGLTGGKDSRLILAVMLGEGIADAYEFVTIGSPSLGDVAIASRLADLFGLRHHVELPRRVEPADYETETREFVDRTAGLVNIIDLHAGLPARDELRVTGLVGESLRNFRVVPERWRGPRLTQRFARFNGFGRLGLVRPDVVADYEAALTAELLADPAGSTDPVDLLGSFFLRNRVRSARVGPSEEVVSQLRVFPLGSIGAVRPAYALPSEMRQAALVHFEVTRRSCPRLLEEPFAGPPWPDELSSFAAVPVQPAAAVDAGHEPFLARVRRTQFDRGGTCSEPSSRNATTRRGRSSTRQWRSTRSHGSPSSTGPSGGSCSALPRPHCGWAVEAHTASHPPHPVIDPPGEGVPVGGRRRSRRGGRTR